MCNIYKLHYVVFNNINRPFFFKKKKNTGIYLFTAMWSNGYVSSLCVYMHVHTCVCICIIIFCFYKIFKQPKKCSPLLYIVLTDINYTNLSMADNSQCLRKYSCWVTVSLRGFIDVSSTRSPFWLGNTIIGVYKMANRNS